MYNVTVVNNFEWLVTVDADDTRQVAPGQTLKIPVRLGNAWLQIPGIGQMLLRDVGDQQIGGYSKATWGVFIAYQGEEVVFRYEGEGQLTITFNGFGQAELSSNGAISYIKLGAFKLPGE